MRQQLRLPWLAVSLFHERAAPDARKKNPSKNKFKNATGQEFYGKRAGSFSMVAVLNESAIRTISQADRDFEMSAFIFR
jgi:hypothetical protein